MNISDTGMTIEQFNEEFLNIVDDPSKEKKASVAGSRFVRMKLREEGVMRRYFGELMEPVTHEDTRYQIDPNHSDSGYMLLDREPDSYALKLTMRGEPTGEYIQADKWIVPFKKFMSPVWEKNEMELKNIRMPITEVIRHNVILDMQEEEDTHFFKVLDSAITQTDNVINVTDTYFRKKHMKALFNMIDTNRLKADTLVMARPTLNDVYEWDYTEVGNLISRVTEDGVDELGLGGKRLITTSNTDVIPRGEIYAMTSPEFAGSAFELGDPRFWMQKKKDLLRMSSWFYSGFNLGNIKSVAKIVLADEE